MHTLQKQRITYGVVTVALDELIDSYVILMKFGSCVVPSHYSFSSWKKKRRKKAVSPTQT